MIYKILSASLLVLSTSSYAASFDCAKAKSNNEKIICSNESISKMDDDLSQNYKELISLYKDTKAIKTWQKDWLISLKNQCKDAKCLEDSYKNRIKEIKSALKADEITKSWTGSYVEKNNQSTPNKIILIGLDGGRVYVKGSAIYNQNVGEIDGYGKLTNSKLKEIEESELCGATFQTKQDGSLIVENESGCGGLNVTFNGVYKRQ